MTYNTNFRRFAVFITAAVTATALAACGENPAPNNDAKQQDVATIVGTKSPSAAASSAAVERPLIRPDTSDEEKDRLDQLWNECRKANGAKMEIYQGEEIVDKTAPESERATEKCVNKLPEDLWERAKRTDPLYEDKLRAWVKCIQSHGIKAKAEGKFLSYEKGLPSEAEQKFVDQCEMDAFGKG